MAQNRFSWFDLIITLVSGITLVLDFASDVGVSVDLYSRGWILWCGLTAAFIVLPHLAINVVSAKWHSADSSLTSPSILLPHVCLLAFFYRYARVVWLGLLSTLKGHTIHIDAALREQNDASILRLIQTFLQSAPQLVVQLSFMLICHSVGWLQVFSAACSLVSLSWALTVYCDSARLNYQTPYVRRFLAMVFLWLWQVFMVTARVAALVLFTSVLQAWVCLFVGIHWIVMTLWISVKGTEFCKGKLEKAMMHVVFGFIYVFVFLNLREGQTRSRMVPYYILAFLENGCLFSIWMVYGKPSVHMKIAASVLVFGGFLLGMLCLIVYYRWFHPRGPHFAFSVNSKLPTSQLQSSHLVKQQEEAEPQTANSSALLSKDSILELSVESETGSRKGATGESQPFLVAHSTMRDELESAWQSGMQSGSDDISSCSDSSLDADDCSLDHFNATVRSDSLKDRPQSEHGDSACEPPSHHADTSQHSMLSYSLHPSDYSVTSPFPSQLHACSMEPHMEDVEEDVEMVEDDRSVGATASVPRQQQAPKPRKKRITQRLAHAVDTLSSPAPSAPGRPSLHCHPSSTPTAAKTPRAHSKSHLRAELAAGKFDERTSSLNDSDVVASPDVGLPQPEPHFASSASDVLPSGQSVSVEEQVSQSFDPCQSPIVSPESCRQSTTGDMMLSREASYIRADREAMAAFPDLVESLSPDPRQPKLYLGSDDMYGERAGGESMWGVSPNISSNSGSQGKEQQLFQPAGAPDLVDSFNSGSPCYNPMCLQDAHPTEDLVHEGDTKSSSASDSPAVDSPVANNNTTETSWTSMHVNENEWSGLNNLKALTPDESLCSFSSNDREPEAQQQSTEEEEEEEYIEELQDAPKVGAEEGAFSRCSTPTSLPRSRSTSSVYHEFSSAGVSPSPPPGLKTACRGMSRHHSWVNSPFSSSSQQWRQSADTSWPMDYPIVDPAPPVESDLYPSHGSDPREVVIQMLMDQLRRTSLRSNQYLSESPRFSPLASSRLAPHNGRMDCWEREALRGLMSEDADRTLVSHPDQQHPQGRRSYTGDIDLMRKALDLIERERFPHRFLQEVPDDESPEMYVSGQYRPPILDQKRDSPQHPSVLRASAGAGSRSRSQLNTSSTQAPVHPAASHPTSLGVAGQRRSGQHPHGSNRAVADLHRRGEEESGPGSVVGGQREGLYRYFVHSNSPIHTPQTTPSQRHLLQRYLTQSHVWQAIREEHVQSAETRSLRRSFEVGDQRYSTEPAQTRRLSSDAPSDIQTGQVARTSSTLPHGFVAHGPGRASDINRPPGRTTSKIQPDVAAAHAGRRTADSAPQHTLAPRPGRAMDMRHFSQKLEVQTDNPDSGMHSGSHSGMHSGMHSEVHSGTHSGMHSRSQSAASRRHPLQSLDNSPSLSPSSSVTQPVHSKPPSHAHQLQPVCSSDKQAPPHSSSAGRSGLAGQPQGPPTPHHPDSPKHSTRSSRAHSPRHSSRSGHPGQVHVHRQSGDKSGDRSRRAAASLNASEGSAVARTRSVDCLR